MRLPPRRNVSDRGCPRYFRNLVVLLIYRRISVRRGRLSHNGDSHWLTNNRLSLYEIMFSFSTVHPNIRIVISLIVHLSMRRTYLRHSFMYHREGRIRPRDYLSRMRPLIVARCSQSRFCKQQHISIVFRQPIRFHHFPLLDRSPLLGFRFHGCTARYGDPRAVDW